LGSSITPTSVTVTHTTMPVLKEGRRFVFTLNLGEWIDDQTDGICPDEWENVRYCIYQLELGESGNFHYQGYVEFKRATRPQKLFEIDERAHWENALGTPFENINYCSKDSTKIDGPFEIGHKKSQGERSDVRNLKLIIKNGGSLKDVFNAEPWAFIRYSNGIQKAINLFAERRTQKTHVILVFGNTGLGKSRWAWEQSPDAYPKMANNTWWDGYNGTDDIIIDEFKGGLPYTYLLKLLDGYPMLVEVKGGHLVFNPKNIIITCSVHPANWYHAVDHFNYAELSRRFDDIVHFVDFGSSRKLTNAEFEELVAFRI